MGKASATLESLVGYLIGSVGAGGLAGIAASHLPQRVIQSLPDYVKGVITSQYTTEQLATYIALTVAGLAVLGHGYKRQLDSVYYDR